MIEEKSLRVQRCKDWYKRNGLSKNDWIDITGFSEAQFYRWHAVNGKSSPTADQLISVLVSLDINPLKIWLDIGPDRISDLKRSLYDLENASKNFIAYWGEEHQSIREGWERQQRQVEEIHAWLTPTE